MITNQVKVTVITVVYNDVKNIEKTIKNVLKQTYTNVEYIVIDGNSKDGTVESIQKYSDRLTWLSEPDKGIYDAMQKGVSLASGEWIIFRNCGDFFINPDTIEQVFASYEDKGEDFIVCNTRYFNNYGFIDVKPSILTKHYFEDMPFGHPSTFIRRRTQQKYPFHLKYRNSADYCFFIEAIENGATYKYIDMLVGLFDVNTGATSDHFDVSFQNNIEILTQFNAPLPYIKSLEKQFKIYKIKRMIKKIIPFYSIFNNHKYKRLGWKKESLSTILKDI